MVTDSRRGSISTKKTRYVIEPNLTKWPKDPKGTMLLLSLYELEIQDQQHQVWLVVSTHLKNISQIGNLPQIGVKIKHIWNHHLEVYWDKPKSSDLQDVRYFRGFPQRFLWSFFPVSFLRNLDVDILTKKNNISLQSTKSCYDVK